MTATALIRIVLDGRNWIPVGSLGCFLLFHHILSEDIGTHITLCIVFVISVAVSSVRSAAASIGVLLCET
jgi:hypothetical protein